MEHILGLLLLFLSMIVQVIIPPIPAELIVIAAGKAWGILITSLVAGTGLWIGSILVYYFGRYLHKKFDKFFNKEKVKNITHKLKEYETAILWIRILPYNPSDTISYTAGLLKFDKKKFILITFITSYARCFMLAALGNYITSMKTLFMVLVILTISSIIASIILKKNNKKRNIPKN